jgi:hypothetical protein
MVYLMLPASYVTVDVMVVSYREKVCENGYIVSLLYLRPATITLSNPERHA